MNISEWIKAMLLMLCVTPLARPVLGAEVPVTITVGSKSFTESVILADMLRHLSQQAGFEAHHRRQLGGTRVLSSVTEPAKSV